MKDDYRINVRFHLDNPEEKEAADYLRSLGKSRNQFIVEAVTEFIRRENQSDRFSLGDIRQMFREELQAVSISQPQSEIQRSELSEQEQAENIQNILDDLAMFD